MIEHKRRGCIYGIEMNNIICGEIQLGKLDCRTSWVLYVCKHSSCIHLHICLCMGVSVHTYQAHGA